MRRRRLRPDEEELWRKATEKTDQIRFNKLVGTVSKNTFSD